MKSIFNGMKKVRKDLINYKKENGVRFFTIARIVDIMIETFIKTFVLWLILLVTLVIAFWPNSSIISGEIIQRRQIITFVIASIVILVLIIVIFKNIIMEYKTYVGVNSYASFVSIMKVWFMIGSLTIIALLGQTQLYVMNHYLTPPLESCTYYDWYGNELYSDPVLGNCSTLYNVSIDGGVDSNHKTIQFGVIEPESLQFDQRYVSYTYLYDQDKLIKRSLQYYFLTSEEIKTIERVNINDLPLLRVDEITNTYASEEFKTEYTKKYTNQDGELNTVYSKTVIAKREDPLINDENLKTEMSNVINITQMVKDGSQEIEKKYQLYADEHNYGLIDFYTVEAYNPNIYVNYYSVFQNGSKLDLKKIWYVNSSANIDDNRLPIINRLTSNGKSFDFKWTDKYGDKTIFDQLNSDSNEIEYRHVFNYTDYGFKVMHYNYSRDNWRRYSMDDQARSDLCYANNGFKQYDYEKISDPSYFSNCGAPLFYYKNPLFLE